MTATIHDSNTDENLMTVFADEEGVESEEQILANIKKQNTMLLETSIKLRGVNSSDNVFKSYQDLLYMQDDLNKRCNRINLPSEVIEADPLRIDIKL